MGVAKRIPAEGFHLSVFVADEMKARGWKLAHVASLMPGPYAESFLELELLFGVHDTQLLLGTLGRRLDAAFDVSEGYHDNLDRMWREWMFANGRREQEPPPEVTEFLDDSHPHPNGVV